MHHQTIGPRPKNGDMLAIMHRDLRDPYITGALQRVVKQRVGLFAGMIRRHVEGAFEVNRIHFG